MRHLGEFQEAGRQARTRSHRQLSVHSRLLRSLDLAMRFLPHVDVGRRVDDPSPFYQRARDLGLYIR